MDTCLVDAVRKLSPEERTLLLSVLERDLQFQHSENKRLESIKAQVYNVRETSPSVAESISNESVTSHHSTNTNNSTSARNECTTCRVPIARFFHSKCIRCRAALCDKCKIEGRQRRKWYCARCAQDREWLAASGQWTNQNENAISNKLLNYLKTNAGNERGRPPAPPITRRHLTLPSFSSANLLAVPNGSAIPTQKPHSWSGRSPSPRRNIAASLIPLHPSEIIGSPAPRAAPQKSARIDECDTPQNGIPPLPTRFSCNSPRNTNSPKRRQSEAIMPTFSLSRYIALTTVYLNTPAVQEFPSVIRLRQLQKPFKQPQLKKREMKKMSGASGMRSLALCLLIVGVCVLAERQTIKVKGIAVCNMRRFANAHVELREQDTLDPDDSLSNVHTNIEGEFELNGEEDEMGTIKPYIRISHNCGAKPGCTRIADYWVPEEKVNGVYDMTYVTLDIVVHNEKESCD